MDTQFGANGVATFLLLSRPINFSPIPIASAVSNIQFGFPHGRRTALSTGILATGLGLSAAYAGISLGGYWHEQSITSTVPVQWMEHPADYVPPVMDLFTEDRVPLGYSNASPDVCRKDLEHLERAFDLLKYQYLFKTYGVPLDNQDLLLVRPLRILGNTSSGSAAEVFSAMTPLPYFILSTNGGDSADFSSSKFTYIMTMAAVFGLVATFLSRESAVKASAIAEPSWEEHKHDGNCTFTPPKEVVGILMNPEQSIEQLFEEDPFTDTYTPYVVLTFHDDDSYAYSNVQWREDDSAPDGFAARFDAPQDALASLKELRNMTEGFLFNLLRFIVLGSAIIVCFALHVMVFLVKGRFGRRGIKQLMKRFKKAKSSKTNLTLAVEKDDTEARHQTIEMSGQGIETFSLPERSDSNDIKQSNEIIKPPMEHDTQPAPECGTNASVAIPKAEEMVASEAEPCSLSDPSRSNPMTPIDTGIDTLLDPVISIVTDSPALVTDASITDATETSLSPTMAIACGAPVTAIASSSAPIDETVETSLAPVVDEGSLDDESWTVLSKRQRGRNRRGKLMSAIDDSDRVSTLETEPSVASSSTLPLPFMTPRKRGRRGHGRGR